MTNITPKRFVRECMIIVKNVLTAFYHDEARYIIMHACVEHWTTKLSLNTEISLKNWFVTGNLLIHLLFFFLFCDRIV